MPDMPKNTTTVVDETSPIDSVNPSLPPEEMTLEQLTLLVTIERVKSLEDKTKAEYEALRDRQGKVTFLHRLLKTVNLITDGKDQLNLNQHPDLKEMIQQAKDLGADIDPSKMTYTKDERDKFVESLRITCDDLNIQNDMQIQTVTRLTNERYETFQLAKSMFRPLDEAKTAIARSIAGR